MKGTIFVFSNGELKRKQNTIYFEGEGGIKKFIPIENTNEIHIFGEISVNKDILEFLSQNEIILHFYNYYGYYVGSFYPREHYNSGYLILKQAEFYLDNNRRLGLARKFVFGAVSNIEKVLNYYKARGVFLDDIIEKIQSLKYLLNSQNQIESLMAIEGNIREVYYNSFDRIVDDENFSMDDRSKRPPKNRMNAMISFGNSLLYTTILSEIYKTHLDPRIGYLHSTNFRRFTLNLDVAEVFKPIIVDRVIFYLLNKQMIKPTDFDQRLGGLYLKETGRKIFVEKFEERLNTTIKHRKIGKNVSYRRLIRLELYKIEKHLINEEEYEPFISEWWNKKMYVIMVYDVNEKRVNKVLKIGRKYLNWIQNSVLEGEITIAKYEKLKMELLKIINKEEDSVIFYILRTTMYSKREIIGLTKGGSKLII